MSKREWNLSQSDHPSDRWQFGWIILFHVGQWRSQGDLRAEAEIPKVIFRFQFRRFVIFQRLSQQIARVEIILTNGGKSCTLFVLPIDGNVLRRRRICRCLEDRSFRDAEANRRSYVEQTMPGVFLRCRRSFVR